MTSKKLSLVTAVFSLCISLNAWGYDRYDPLCDTQPSCNDRYDACCDFQPSCDNWDIYGDLLYWRARRCELDYAVPFDSATSVSIGKVYEVEPRYNIGFRVGFKKDILFDASYTFFRNKFKDSVANATGDLAATHFIDDVGGVTQGGIAYAQGKWDLCYDVVDILAGYEISNFNCLQTYVFGGLKLAYIDQTLESFYSNVVPITGAAVRVTEKIDMGAYGLDLGIGTDYALSSCINLFGRVSYDLLIGDFKRKFIYDTSGDGGATFTRDIHLNDHCWRMISVFNLAFGLRAYREFEHCCFTDIGFSLGYEFHQWVSCPDFLEFQNESGEITFDRHLQSLGFDGLFARFSIGF